MVVQKMNYTFKLIRQLIEANKLATMRLLTYAITKSSKITIKNSRTKY